MNKTPDSLLQGEQTFGNDFSPDLRRESFFFRKCKSSRDFNFFLQKIESVLVVFNFGTFEKLDRISMITSKNITNQTIAIFEGLNLAIETSFRV